MVNNIFHTCILAFKIVFTASVQDFELVSPFLHTFSRSSQTNCFTVSTKRDEIFEFNETLTVFIRSFIDRDIVSERNETVVVIVDDDGESLYIFYCVCYIYIPVHVPVFIHRCQRVNGCRAYQ